MIGAGKRRRARYIMKDHEIYPDNWKKRRLTLPANITKSRR
jgi:hypothetical protein